MGNTRTKMDLAVTNAAQDVHPTAEEMEELETNDTIM